MKLFAFKCKKVLTFGLGSVIIGTVKKRQSEYTYEKGLFPWLYIRGVSTSKKPRQIASAFCLAFLLYSTGDTLALHSAARSAADVPPRFAGGTGYYRVSQILLHAMCVALLI